MKNLHPTPMCQNYLVQSLQIKLIPVKLCTKGWSFGRRIHSPLNNLQCVEIFSEWGKNLGSWDLTVCF